MPGCEDLVIQVSQIIPFDIMLPAVGQGSLCIEIRKDDDRIYKIVSCMNDAQTKTAVEAERALLAKLQGGCQVPIGAYAQINGNELHLEAIICTMDGDHAIRARKSSMRVARNFRDVLTTYNITVLVICERNSTIS